MRFLFVDRIVTLVPGEATKGIKHITREDHYLCKDESGNAVFIPSLIGETLGQLAAWNVMSYHKFSLRPVAGVVAKAQLHRSARVGETLLLETTIESLDDRAVLYSGTARVGNELVFSLEGALGPLLPMQDFIDQETVKLQFEEVNRPGDWQAIVNAMSLNTPSNQEGIGALSFGYDRFHYNAKEQQLTAEKQITRASPYFPDHFPKKPVLPMTILLDCNMNLARDFLEQLKLDKSFVVKELRKIKMNEFVLPGDKVITNVKVKNQSEEEIVLFYRSEVEGQRVCVLELVLQAKG